MEEDGSEDKIIMIRNTFKALADLLLPRKCIVCGEKLTLEEEHLCRWCRDQA